MAPTGTPHATLNWGSLGPDLDLAPEILLGLRVDRRGRPLGGSIQTPAFHNDSRAAGAQLQVRQQHGRDDQLWEVWVSEGYDRGRQDPVRRGSDKPCCGR